MGYPLARMARVALRADLLRRQMQRAEKMALARAMSLKCAGGQWSTYVPVHAGADGGCVDDGTACLCECHDREA